MRPLGSSLLKIVGLEFPAYCVTRVDLGEALPLLWQVIYCEDRGHRADRYAGSAINALYWIDVELFNVVEARPTVLVHRVFFRVYAILRTGVHAGRVFDSNTRFGNDERHGLPPFVLNRWHHGGSPMRCRMSRYRTSPSGRRRSLRGRNSFADV